VALKTAGLLQLMLQSGFLIPVDERSRFRLFSGLFLDLGDEQSVASDLSTYTSHLFQMRLMGDHMDGNSLFLIDEFGSGTDPELGGAIAEAFLERFIRQEAFGLITTHYGNLKEVAGRNSEVVNAAMEFDTKGLRPTFRMVEGIPGRSYAFEIAARVGVHPTILRRARRKLGKERVHTEDLLKEMETKNRELESLLSQNRQKEAKLAAMVGNYEKLSSELESGKKEILRNAKAEARDLIKSANRDIERTIREIREQQAEKKFTKKIRKELSAKMPEPEEALPLPPPQLEDPEMEGGPVKVGDWVRIRDAEESIGKLVELKGKRAIVEMGDLRMHIKLDQLIRTRKPPKKKPVRKGSSGVSLSKMGDAMQDLNLMGMRVEEALPVVDKAIDNAMIVGLPSLRILHGKGTGTLREAIRRHLSGNPLIDSMEDAAVEQGGTGWTLVRFRA
jgi:DNA mismatch repair protein MutS2